jgi:hypothetical protein
MPGRINRSLSWWVSAPVIVACLVAASAGAQTAREVRGAAAVEPLENEPPAKIVVDPPLAESLSHGRVVIQYRAENLHIVPVFGAAALAVSPRIGHVHVTVDDAPWVWADASGDPVIINGLPPGPHKVLIQLETANHQLLDQGMVGARCFSDCYPIAFRNRIATQFPFWHDGVLQGGSPESNALTNRSKRLPLLAVG